MTSPFGKAVVIRNARAGKGGLQRAALQQMLESTGLDFVIEDTERRGHAAEIAADAVESGITYLVAVGGDGTIHEVVNGMMTPTGPRREGLVLGVIPAGSGSDFIRTFGLPASAVDAVRHLSGERVFAVDAGRITIGFDEQERVVHFANIAEAGLGGEVVKRAQRLPRFAGRVRYLIAFWMTLGFFRPADGKVTLDNRTYEGQITNLVVANGQFFGGGMRIAPKAHPGDGKFDVLIQKGTKRDYIAGITKVFKGEHLPSPVIKEYHSKRVELWSSSPYVVEADGEVLGLSPATFEIVPNAYSLKI